MAGEKSIPAFDAWVHYCFTLGGPDFKRAGDEDDIQRREETYVCIDPRVIAEFLCRLFNSCEELVDRYSPDTLGAGTWFIFGVGSGFFHEVRESVVPAELQVEVYSTMARMYTHCFDKLCNRRGTCRDDVSDTDELDGAVYMIWDMDCVEGGVMFPDRNPHLVEPGFATLETVLLRCSTPSCIKGALHALGHLHHYHRDRCAGLFAKFFNERGRSVPGWLFEYASAARTGMVQ